jgi:UDP-GlcNAc:undecaprenyl-phosphate GlcNAc-1-phosphate transferase
MVFMININAVLVALFVSVMMSVALQPVAARYGLLDIPGGRKKHCSPTPVIGGIAVYSGMLAAMLVDFPPSSLILSLMLASGVLLAIGVVDDYKGVGPAKRLVAEVVAVALVMSIGGLTVTETGLVWPGVSIELGWLGLVLTVVGVVGMVNAFNMMDGIDGLASGVVLISLLGILLFSNITGDSTQAGFVAILIVSVGVFFLRNLGVFGRKIFLGDAGSMMLGFSVMVLLLDMAQSSSAHSSFSAIDALWCVAIPLFDIITLIVRRILKGVHPFKPDRTHLHHVMMRMGFTPRQTLVLMLGAASGYVVLGALFKVLAPSLSLYVFILLGVWYVYVMTRAWRFLRWVRRFARQLAARQQ